tara:strand:+ start:694 stop:795 length:102 start_codon:yes stop_codon:yes gene_type:complete
MENTNKETERNYIRLEKIDNANWKQEEKKLVII